MGQGGADARSMSSENQVWLGQYGATNRTCSSSPGSVQKGSLGEMHICEGPGASCAPVHPCQGEEGSTLTLQGVGSRAVVKSTFVESKTSPSPKRFESESRPSPKRFESESRPSPKRFESKSSPSPNEKVTNDNARSRWS